MPKQHVGFTSPVQRVMFYPEIEVNLFNTYWAEAFGEADHPDSQIYRMIGLQAWMARALLEENLEEDEDVEPTDPVSE